MNKWMSALAVALALNTANAAATEFTDLAEFGDNPGQLTASYLQPNDKANKLVVLLHGCGQNAEQLAQQSGFVEQAKEHNFSLLLPQQASTNNATVCFNWFSESDQNKGQGETQSIVNMIKAAKDKTKASDVYIVGLSAGGAMTSSLLVQYPDMFTAGAVIAGIPYPCANNLVKAISCMKSGSELTPAQLAKSVHGSAKSWPQLTVITGDKDNIVNPKNSEQMAQQWAYLNAEIEPKVSNKDQMSITRYGNSSELIRLADIGHGFPVNSSIKAGGQPSAFVLESPLSAANYLVKKWIVK